MSTSPWLTLVASDIGGAAFVRHATEAPTLAKLAGRGAVSRLWLRDDRDAVLRPWQRGLAATLNLPAASLASAAVSAPVGHAGYWMHADPVHFVAGLDRLSFMALRDEAKVTEVERSALFETLAPQFADGEFALISDAGAWFIRASRSLQVATSTPEAAAANDLPAVMPRGPDAPPVRRLMTEMQMLLHEHPVNEARSRRGLPAINAIWMWGGGLGSDIVPASLLPQAFGDDAFVAGLYRHGEKSVKPLPGSVEALLDSIRVLDRAIAVVPEPDLRVLDAQWLAPLSRALAAGNLSRLDLILEEWHVDVRRADVRKFWRRPLTATKWGEMA